MLFSNVLWNIMEMYEHNMKGNKIRIIRKYFGRYDDIIGREKLNMMDIIKQYYITKMDTYNKYNIVIILRGKVWINKCY